MTIMFVDAGVTASHFETFYSSMCFFSTLHCKYDVCGFIYIYLLYAFLAFCTIYSFYFNFFISIKTLENRTTKQFIDFFQTLFNAQKCTFHRIHLKPILLLALVLESKKLSRVNPLPSNIFFKYRNFPSLSPPSYRFNLSYLIPLWVPRRA